MSDFYEDDREHLDDEDIEEQYKQSFRKHGIPDSDLKGDTCHRLTHQWLKFIKEDSGGQREILQKRIKTVFEKSRPDCTIHINFGREKSKKE